MIQLAVKRFPAAQGKQIAVAKFLTPVLVPLGTLLLMILTAAMNMAVMRTQISFLYTSVTHPVHLEVFKINYHTLAWDFMDNQWSRKRNVM